MNLDKKTILNQLVEASQKGFVSLNDSALFKSVNIENEKLTVNIEVKNPSLQFKNKISEFLKNQEWFNPTFAQSLVDMLGDISKADNVNENEKGNLRNLAEFWGVKSPI